MEKPIRASWGRPFLFTVEHKSDLRYILRKQDADKTNDFLESVQAHAAILKMSWQIAGDPRPETTAKSISLLKKIAKSSRALDKAINQLDLTGSEIALVNALGEFKRGGETIEYLKSDLPIVNLAAEAAISTSLAPRVGRNPDAIEKYFIANVGKSYVKCFEKRPTYSRDTEFPIFIAEVLGIILPGNTHSACDNSKIVTAALKSVGIIS